MNELDLAAILRRLANRIGKDNQLHVVRALNDEADFISPHPKPEQREWWFIKSIGVGPSEHRYGWARHDVKQDGVDYLEQVHVREVLD